MALALSLSCTRTPVSRPVVELGGPTMGAAWSVKVVSATITEQDRNSLQQVIQATLAGIERLLSTWDPASELSRFNASTSLDPFAVAPETFEAFRWAATLWAETGGAMDPTVGPLIDAWGFGADRPAALPDDATVERLRADIGMPLVELDPAGAWVRKHRPGVRCNFSAFVPGWAADRIASQLVARGYTDFLVDVGGELVARGRNAEGNAWQVAIERPQVEGRSVARVVSLENVAISTSGDYRNFRALASGRLPHILDPRTGRPVKHTLASVVSPCGRSRTRRCALDRADGHGTGRRDGLRARARPGGAAAGADRGRPVRGAPVAGVPGWGPVSHRAWPDDRLAKSPGRALAA